MAETMVLTEEQTAQLQELMDLMEVKGVEEFFRMAGPILAQAKAQLDFNNQGVNLAIMDSSSWFC